MPRYECAHCGLRVVTRSEADPAGVFCCSGCALASRIVGQQEGEGERAWNVLRLGIAGFLTMNVMMISILLYTGKVEAWAIPAFHWVLLGLSTPILLLLGYPLVVAAGSAIGQGRPTLDLLIAVGALAAFGWSAGNTVRGSGEVYYDTATMLLALVTFGKMLEATAKVRASQLIRSLERLIPERARRIEGEVVREVSVAEVRAGDRIWVAPGERFAADGRVIQGSSVVEEAAFTGESEARACGQGDEVIAGAVNGPGGLCVEVTAVGDELLLRRMVAMVENARQRPSRTERISEKAARVFVPFVLILAIGAGGCWLATVGVVKGAGVALAVLAVACPCAIGVATSLATTVAVGRAGQAGVMVRSGEAMERVGEIETMFVDKTGTLTTGEPTVLRIEVVDGETSEEEILGWLAGAETLSEHSLGRAVMKEAARRGIASGVPHGVEVTPGVGLRAEVTRGGVRHEVTVGNGGRALNETSTLGPETVIAVSWEGRVRGKVYMVDAMRAGAERAVKELREAGVETVLLSGDRLGAAKAAARQAGIERVEAPRLPDEKIESIRRQGGTVGMVGDGINDAPALAAAGVGVAMGSGTDLARQTADVVVISNRLEQVPWLMALSRRTRRIIKQNLAWSFAYNIVALGAAAMGWLHPLLAALAMTVSSLTVLGNSMRLQGFPELGGDAGLESGQERPEKITVSVEAAGLYD